MTLKIGVILLLLSMEVYLSALNNQPTYNWVPATAPLVLKKDKPTQLSFVADADHEYNIELSFEKKLSFDALDRTLSKMKDSADFEIQVKENNKKIDADGYSGMSYSDTISVVPTSFQASRGRRYTVTITPKKSFPNLEVTNPQAQISVEPIEYMHFVVGWLYYSALTSLLFLSGLILTLVGWWRRR